jgi:Zn-dependent peptidase ImmA (M78 family)
MATRATALNPAVLRWAREQIGLSVEDAASRISKAPEDLQAWENGEAYPTFNQLESLAERVYKRPVALFFLPAPPAEPPPTSEFRTLPELERESLEPDTLLALREARAFRESLRELTGGRNPAERRIWRDLRAADRDGERLARRVREYLAVDLDTQTSWGSTRQAMIEWRAVVEAVGVFVFKRSFQQREVSGLCLDDEEFPLLLINNSTASSRQIFTLFHELAHILFDVSGVTTVDTSFVERLTGDARRIEIACNRFAAEFLVPSEAFPWQDFRTRPYDVALESAARRFKVSREVILRRLLDAELVTAEEYRTHVLRWHDEYQQQERGSGGDYYNTQAAYLGPAFLDLAFGQYYAGRVTLPELAEHLGMKAKNVGRLEEKLLARK